MKRRLRRCEWQIEGVGRARITGILRIRTGNVESVDLAVESAQVRDGRPAFAGRGVRDVRARRDHRGLRVHESAQVDHVVLAFGVALRGSRVEDGRAAAVAAADRGEAESAHELRELLGDLHRAVDAGAQELGLDRRLFRGAVVGAEVRGRERERVRQRFLEVADSVRARHHPGVRPWLVERGVGGHRSDVQLVDAVHQRALDGGVVEVHRRPARLFCDLVAAERDLPAQVGEDVPRVRRPHDRVTTGVPLHGVGEGVVAVLQAAGERVRLQPTLVVREEKLRAGHRVELLH